MFASSFIMKSLIRAGCLAENHVKGLTCPVFCRALNGTLSGAELVWYHKKADSITKTAQLQITSESADTLVWGFVVVVFPWLFAQHYFLFLLISHHHFEEQMDTAGPYLFYCSLLKEKNIPQHSWALSIPI